MSLPEKLLEKTFYWGPLFVGIVSLIIGVIFVRAVGDVNGEIPLAKLQLDGTNKSIPQSSSRMVANADALLEDKKLIDELGEVEKPASLQDTPVHKKQLTDPQNNTRVALSPAVSQKKTTKNIDEGDGLKVIPPKETREEQIVRVTIPQLVSLHSSQIGAHAPLAISGFRQTTLSPSLIGLQYSGSELGHWGPLSHFGLKTSTYRSGYISVMASAEGLGDSANAFIHGLSIINDRSARPLIAHRSEKIGQNFLTSYKGLQRSGENGSLIQEMFLSEQGVELGGMSASASNGLSITTIGSQTLLKKFKIVSIGGILGKEISSKNLKGVNRAVVNAGEMKLTTLSLAVPGELSGQGKSAHLGKSDLPCSLRFYAALQDLRSTKISAIRTVAQPISRVDKSLPGKWIFSPPAFKTRSVCKKYKYYRSGRKKCVKWAKSLPKNTAYTPEEKDYILTAQKIITGRGRHPMVKPRSPSHWVINIVAQNLNSYSSQKQHPALCTGALGMVDYFEGNLTRFRKHMMSIATLNEQSKAHILNQVERLNASLKKQTTLKTISAEIDSVTQNQRIIVSSYDPLTVNGQAVAALFGEDVGLEILSRDTFLDSLKLTRTLIKSRKPHIHASTYGQFLRLATILEATYYIQKTHDKYKILEQKLFGSLRGIRTAHTNHCNCSN
jgi:hypothetical protein